MKSLATITLEPILWMVHKNSRIKPKFKYGQFKCLLIHWLPHEWAILGDEVARTCDESPKCLSEKSPKKAMKFPRKQACLTDGPTKTEFWKVYVICNTRVYLTVHTFVCGLLFPLHVTLATWFSSTWLSLFVQLIRTWFPFDLIKTSFKITWLSLFAQVVEAAVYSHLSWIVLWGNVLGAIVGCLAELASVYVKGTWLVE